MREFLIFSHYCDNFIEKFREINFIIKSHSKSSSRNFCGTKILIHCAVGRSKCILILMISRNIFKQKLISCLHFPKCYQITEFFTNNFWQIIHENKFSLSNNISCVMNCFHEIFFKPEQILDFSTLKSTWFRIRMTEKYCLTFQLLVETSDVMISWWFTAFTNYTHTIFKMKFLIHEYVTSQK